MSEGFLFTFTPNQHNALVMKSIHDLHTTILHRIVVCLIVLIGLLGHIACKNDSSTTETPPTNTVPVFPPLADPDTVTVPPGPTPAPPINGLWTKQPPINELFGLVINVYEGDQDALDKAEAITGRVRMFDDAYKHNYSLDPPTTLEGSWTGIDMKQAADIAKLSKRFEFVTIANEDKSSLNDDLSKELRKSLESLNGFPNKSIPYDIQAAVEACGLPYPLDAGVYAAKVALYDIAMYNLGIIQASHPNELWGPRYPGDERQLEMLDVYFKMAKKAGMPTVAPPMHVADEDQRGANGLLDSAPDRLKHDYDVYCVNAYTIDYPNNAFDPWTEGGYAEQLLKFDAWMPDDASLWVTEAGIKPNHRAPRYTLGAQSNVFGLVSWRGVSSLWSQGLIWPWCSFV